MEKHTLTTDHFAQKYDVPYEIVIDMSNKLGKACLENGVLEKELSAMVESLKTIGHTNLNENVLNTYAIGWAARAATRVLYPTLIGNGDSAQQEKAVAAFMRDEIRKHPKRQYVTLAELSRYVDRLALFSKTKDGARLTRQKTLQRMIDRKTIAQRNIVGNGKGTAVLFFVNHLTGDWDVKPETKVEVLTGDQLTARHEAGTL